MEVLMESNSSLNFNETLQHSNVTLEEIVSFLNLNITNVTNESVETKVQLFDLYEVYKSAERDRLVIYKSVAYVLGTLIILSNLVVVISSGLILKKGQQPKSTYLLLGNVSLADTIIGISIIFGALADNTNSSNWLCVFQIGMIVCPTMVSIFSVGLIAVDRYIYILHGLYYQRWFNTTRVRIGIIIIWVVGIFIASLPAMGWTGRTFTDFRCWYIALFPSTLLIVVSIIALSTIIMVCVLYCLILQRAVKTVDEIRAFQETRQNIAYINKAFEAETKFDEITETETSLTITVKTDQNIDCETNEIIVTEINIKSNDTVPWKANIKDKLSKITNFYCKAKRVESHVSKLKAVKTVLIVTACLLSTWAPYYIAVILYVDCNIMRNGYVCVPLEMLTLGPLYLLGVCNSLCDPLIYAWFHNGFKTSALKIYLKYVWRIKIFKRRYLR